MENLEVEFRSRDYSFKIVECLQQNWALIDEDAGRGCTVFFSATRRGVRPAAVSVGGGDGVRAAPEWISAI